MICVYILNNVQRFMTAHKFMPIVDIIKSHNVQHAQYANNILLSMALSQASSQAGMSECFAAVHKLF
jgi:hypothetical protein